MKFLRIFALLLIFIPIIFFIVNETILTSNSIGSKTIGLITYMTSIGGLISLFSSIIVSWKKDFKNSVAHLEKKKLELEIRILEKELSIKNEKEI